MILRALSGTCHPRLSALHHPAVLQYSQRYMPSLALALFIIRLCLLFVHCLHPSLHSASSCCGCVVSLTAISHIGHRPISFKKSISSWSYDHHYLYGPSPMSAYSLATSQPLRTSIIYGLRPSISCHAYLQDHIHIIYCVVIPTSSVISPHISAFEHLLALFYHQHKARAASHAPSTQSSSPTLRVASTSLVMHHSV